MMNMKLSVVGCLMLVILCVHLSGGVITKVRSLKKQCIDQGFAGVCSISTKDPFVRNRCGLGLQCAVMKGNVAFKQSGGMVPDGTTCGDKKVCINKKCTPVEVMPTIVGSNEALSCKTIVLAVDKIQPRPLQPLSP